MAQVEPRHKTFFQVRVTKIPGTCICMCETPEVVFPRSDEGAHVQRPWTTILAYKNNHVTAAVVAVVCVPISLPFGIPISRAWGSVGLGLGLWVGVGELWGPLPFAWGLGGLSHPRAAVCRDSVLGFLGDALNFVVW